MRKTTMRKTCKNAPMHALYARNGLKRRAHIPVISEMAEAPDKLMAALSISVSVIGPACNAVGCFPCRSIGTLRMDCSEAPGLIRWDGQSDKSRRSSRGTVWWTSAWEGRKSRQGARAAARGVRRTMSCCWGVPWNARVPAMECTRSTDLSTPTRACAAACGLLEIRCSRIPRFALELGADDAMRVVKHKNKKYVWREITTKRE